MDLSASADLDIVSADMLQDLVDDLRELQVEVLLCQARGKVRDRLRQTGVMQDVHEDHVFLTVDGAVQNYLERFPQVDAPAPVPTA